MSIELKRKRRRSSRRVRKCDKAIPVYPKDWQLSKTYPEILEANKQILNQSGAIRVALNATRTVLMDCGMPQQWRSIKSNLVFDLKKFKLSIPTKKRRVPRKTLHATHKQKSLIRVALLESGITIRSEWDANFILYSDPRNGLIRPLLNTETKWKVLSRSSTRLWITKLTPKGTMTCNCLQYRYKRTCFHVDVTKAFLKKLEWLKEQKRLGESGEKGISESDREALRRLGFS